MIEASCMFLSEWQAHQQKSDETWQAELTLQIFGSFLDRKSLELAWLLVNNPLALDEQVTIQIVFLPICRSFLINQEFKRNLQPLLQIPCTESQYNPAILPMVNHAAEVVSRMRRLYYAQLIDIPPDFSSTRTSQFKENRILFGNLSAQFLEKHTLLPQVRINHRVYNGIPFGLDPISFVQRILTKEISEQLQMQHLLPIELEE